MAKNFCPNCGKPLKPNAKFCGYCGEKIITETKPAIDEEISSTEKTSTNFNTAVDLDNIKQQALSGIDKFKVLPNRIKIIALILVIAIIGYAGYYHFSPEKQVSRTTDTFIENFITLATTDSKNIKEKDIDEATKLIIPNAQKQAKSVFKQYVAGVYSDDKKPTYKITDVKINNDTATVKVKFDEKPNTYIPFFSTFYLKKDQGTWYIDDFE